MSGEPEIKSKNRNENSGVKPSIFISYSRSNARFVKDLAGWLRSAGCEVWQDISGLRGGQTWAGGIEKALRGCDMVVVVLSPESSSSQWVQKETLLALKLRKRILPILLRETEIPVQLIDLYFIDFRDNTEEAVENLLAAISVSGDSHASLRDKPVIFKRSVKPLALFLLGAVLIAAIVYVVLIYFTGNGSISTVSDLVKNVSVSRIAFFRGDCDERPSEDMLRQPYLDRETLQQTRWFLELEHPKASREIGLYIFARFYDSQGNVRGVIKHPNTYIKPGWRDSWHCSEPGLDTGGREPPPPGNYRVEFYVRGSEHEVERKVDEVSIYIR